MKSLALAILAALVFVATTAAADASRFHATLERATRRLEQAGGPEVYAALRDIWDAWDRADPTQVEEALKNAEAEAHLSPPTRAYAGLLSAYARLRRGDFVAARERIRSLGYVDSWLVVGPFDNEGKAGFDAQYGPELAFAEALVPGRAHTGKEGPVRWRAVPDAFPYAYVDTGSLIRPERKACAYLTTFVQDTSKLARSRQMSIWVGSGGAFKLFFNGAMLLEDGAYRGHDAERFATLATLAPGPNNLTLKVCGEERAPIVSVRLADARGAPDARLKASNDLALSEPAAAIVARKHPAAAQSGTKAAFPEPSRKTPARAPQPRGPEGPIQAFERLVAGERPPARALEAYAEYLVSTGGEDPTAHRARNIAQRAAELEPTIDRMLLAASLAEDRNQRARWVERAEALAAKESTPKIDVLLARAALLRESLNFQEAFPLYDRALEIDPDNVTAIRGRAELYNGAGLRRTALTLIERALERQPRSVILLNMYASQLAILGRAVEAREAQARYAALRLDDRTYLSDMIELGLARRDRAATERWIERLVATEPDGQWTLGAAAHGYRGLGESERAVATYQRALELAPDDVGTLRSFADLQGELGRRSDQLALLQQILRLKPQDKEVREYVEYVEPTGSQPDETYAWAPERFLKLAQQPAKGNNRRTLLDLKVSTVFGNGLSSEFRQIVFQPMTDAAAALARQYAFQYQAEQQRVQLRGARVFRSDGRVDSAVESGEGAADNPALAMYTSARTFYVQFPRLEPGDIVELRYRIDDVSAENQFADYFGDITYLESSDPVEHGEYVLVTPKSRQFYFDAKGIPGLKQDVKEQGDQRVYRFWADRLPAVAAEPAMAPWPEVLGFIHVSTFKTWQDLAKWFWGMARDQFDLDDETRQLARRIAGDKKTDVDKVKAVYDWVVRNTRYVALEFGIYGYKPRRCVQTVARGWGDCKDKATVLVTLLKELGVPAQFVIVRSGLRGDFQSSVASLAPFDHAIAYVPALDLYLDGTAEYAGASELPSMDYGALALRVHDGDGGGELVKLPAAGAEQNVRKRDIVATLQPDGKAALKVDYFVRGVQAPSWRRRFHAESTRRQRMEEDLGGEFAGFRLAPDPTAVTTNDLGDFEIPVTLSARGTVDRFGRREGDQLVVSVTPALRLTREYAPLSQRKLPVNLPAIGTLEDTFVIKLPRGMAVRSAPINVTKKTEFGDYSVAVESGGGTVTVTSKLALKVQRVPKERYEVFQAFCAEVDQAFSPRLLLGPSS